jgi:GT2 family glycosyltransferase
MLLLITASNSFGTLRILMKPIKVAVLVTTHNRHTDLAYCLNQLSVACSHAGIEGEVFLSNSGLESFSAKAGLCLPNLRLSEIELPGSFFWASSMRVSWLNYKERINEFKYLLWLNEDTFLDKDSLSRLIREYEESSGPTVLVGSTKSISGALTYGGLRRNKWFNPLFLSLVSPSSISQSCDTFNGNIVFTTPETDLKVGGFPSTYTHLRADLAYGFECKLRSVNALVASGYHGECEANTNYVQYSNFQKMSIKERFRLVFQDPKFGPLREHMRFSLRYGSFMGPLYCLAPIVRALLGR